MPIHSTVVTKMSLVFLMVMLLTIPGSAQSNGPVDVSKVPSEWVWKKGKVENQWKIWTPVRQELQRVFPTLPLGLQVTHYIFYGDAPAMEYTKARYYGVSCMVKKFEFEPFLKKIQPEGETGCWIDIQVNTLNGLHFQLPGMVDKIKFGKARQLLYVCNLEPETDAANNKVLYARSSQNDHYQLGHYFSYNGALPVRKLNKKELFQTYHQYMQELLLEIIGKYKKAPDQQQLLKQYQQELDKLNAWYSEQMQRKDLQSPAVVENLFGDIDPKKLDVAKGYHVWTDDPRFFDTTKQADVPQFVIMRIRRQDFYPNKKEFMDRFSEEFNLDIFAKLTGEAAKKPGGTNTLAASLGAAKKETAKGASAPIEKFDFKQDALGSLPKHWKGMPHAEVRQYEDSLWLAITKPGYIYPRQYNQFVEDGFTMDFKLEWNKDISYYTGTFAVTLGEIPFDQISQEFITTDRNISYNSLYDSYAPGFNRIVLKFDPHFNDAGQLEVIINQKTGATTLTRKILLPGFYREKNKHHLQIGRKGNQLWVRDNDKVLAEIDNAFSADIRYNAYVFSRYKSNNDGEKDAYYIKNVTIQHK